MDHAGDATRFWAEALDWVISQDEDPAWVVEPPEGSGEECVVADLLFIKVPEPPARIARISTCDPSTSSRRLPAWKGWEPPASMLAQATTCSKGD